MYKKRWRVAKRLSCIEDARCLKVKRRYDRFYPHRSEAYKKLAYAELMHFPDCLLVTVEEVRRVEVDTRA